MHWYKPLNRIVPQHPGVKRTMFIVFYLECRQAGPVGIDNSDQI